MQIFLGWRSDTSALQGLEPAQVARKLLNFFAPVLERTPRPRVFSNGFFSFVYLELPVAGWPVEHYQAEASAWALALDYPINAARVLREAGVATEAGQADQAREAGELLALGRRLHEDPLPTLAALHPPFTLLWQAAAEGAIHIQNDGLGFSQLYEFRQGENWAVTNRLFALPALGLPLEPDREAWATKLSLGWFPQTLSGYRHVQVLPPATRLTLDAGGCRRESFPVLETWIRTEPLTAEDCLERGHQALLEYLQDARPLWTAARCGLTGGRDSRAVAALLLAHGLGPSYFRTRGALDEYDVIIAQMLLAAQDDATSHIILRDGTLPPDAPAGLRRSIEFALRWQAGAIEIQGHKRFIRGRSQLGGGDVNIMGQHGELGRGFYSRRIGADASLEQQADHVLRYTRAALRADLRESVREHVRQALAQAERFDVAPEKRVDFFYLFERTRRWASGGHHAEPGKIIAPFLNGKFIHAAQNLTPRQSRMDRFHNHILQRDLPAWRAVPYHNLLNPEQAAAHLHLTRPRGWERRCGKWLAAWDRRLHPHKARYVVGGPKPFQNLIYWQTIGAGLIHEAINAGGLWESIYELRTPEAWHEAPDDFAVLYLLQTLL